MSTAPSHEILAPLERLYATTGNPAYVWAALFELLRPRTRIGSPDLAETCANPPRATQPAPPLPGWVADYLFGAARDFHDILHWRDPANRPDMGQEPDPEDAAWKWQMPPARRAAITHGHLLRAIGFPTGKGHSFHKKVAADWADIELARAAADGRLPPLKTKEDPSSRRKALSRGKLKALSGSSR